MIFGVTFKRNESREHNEGDDTRAPNIDFFTVVLLLHNFWWHVDRTAELLVRLILFFEEFSEAEICQLNDQFLRILYQDILWLDVPVHNALLVHVVDRVEQLPGNILGFLLCQCSH